MLGCLPAQNLLEMAVKRRSEIKTLLTGDEIDRKMLSPTE